MGSLISLLMLTMHDCMLTLYFTWECADTGVTPLDENGPRIKKMLVPTSALPLISVLIGIFRYDYIAMQALRSVIRPICNKTQY